MPTVTSTPVAISANPPDTGQGIAFEVPRFVLFQIGSALYIVLASNFDPYTPGDTSDYRLMVYKSTDAGSSWVRLDGANEPHSIFGNYYASADGTTLQVVFEFTDGASTSKIAYQEFNTVTSLWGIPNLSSVHQGSGNFRAAKSVTGDFIVAFPLAGVGLHALRRSGPAWAAGSFQIVLPAGFNTQEVRGVVFDSTDIIHFVYDKDTGGSSPVSLFYGTITPGNTITSGALISTVSGPGGSAGNSFHCGPMVVWNDRLEVPIGDAVIGGNPGTWEGSPLPGPVTWAFKQADSVVTTYDHIFLPVDASHAEIWWRRTSDQMLMYTPYDGSIFGASVEYWDAENDPVPGGVLPGDRYFFHPTVTVLTTGRGVAVQAPYDEFDPDKISMFFLKGGGGYINRVY